MYSIKLVLIHSLSRPLSHLFKSRSQWVTSNPQSASPQLPHQAHPKSILMFKWKLHNSFWMIKFPMLYLSAISLQWSLISAACFFSLFQSPSLAPNYFWGLSCRSDSLLWSRQTDTVSASLQTLALIPHYVQPWLMSKTLKSTQTLSTWSRSSFLTQSCQSNFAYFTLDCKPLQWLFKIPVWWAEQDHIICKSSTASWKLPNW